MGKTLVLFPDKSAYYFDQISSENITIEQPFDDRTFNKNILLKFLRRFNSSLTRFFYRNWYKELRNYDKVIVFDSNYFYDRSLLRNIRRRNHDIDGFYYSWNIVTDESRYEKERQEVDAQLFTYYCYDRGNCSKYLMKFNTIMYDYGLKLVSSSSIRYDALFLGFLKDRGDIILRIYDKINDAGYKPYFVIVKKGNEENHLPFEFRENYVNYYEYLSMIGMSQAILDVSQKDQDGFSMRVMEAIFFDKKLITTNRSILDAPFYYDGNILVLDVENTQAEEIKQFFEKEFIPYSEELKKYYSFEEWINRFNGNRYDINIKQRVCCE